MKIQFRWVHNNYMDQRPELQFRRTSSELPKVFGRWSSIPHVYLDEPKKPKSTSISKKSAA
jgi:hypothetical protein